MLTNLHVKNMALIEEADVNFGNGLNILSGETGAGKSILLGSIGLALGARANSDMIRHDKEFALVELTFENLSSNVLEKLDEMDIDMSEGQLIITRKIYSNKSITKVNGETMSLSGLKEITELLIDVHGQHEHQSLLKKEKHLEIVDEYAHSNVNEVSKLYHEYAAIKKELDGMSLDEEGRRREMSFLEFEIGEIEDAGLKVGEEEELMSQFKKLSNAVNILTGISEIYEEVGYERGGAGSGIEDAVKNILKLVDYDEELNPIKDQLMDLESLVEDLCSSINSYKDGITVDEEALNDVKTRIDLIHDLKRKYGNSIEDILKHLEKNRDELKKLQDYDNHREELQLDLKLTEDKLMAASEKLSAQRIKAAAVLEKDIKASLLEMNFLDVNFKIDFKPCEICAKGTDDVEFLISTNPGEALKPLERVASGGELSRIMLALKTVLASTYHIDTLIFDEIDTGISGITASCVGRMLTGVSQTCQVICISHLPQIVARADRHFLIAKNVENEKTYTNITVLNDEQSVREVARLLGGDNITDNTLTSARELKSGK